MKNDKGKGFASRWETGLQILYGDGTLPLRKMPGTVFRLRTVN